MSAILFPKCDFVLDSSRVLVVLWKCLRASWGSGGVFFSPDCDFGRLEFQITPPKKPNKPEYISGPSKI